METEKRPVDPWTIVKWLVVFLVSALVLIGTGLSLIPALAVAILLVVLVLNLDAGIPLALALVMLVLCGLMLLLNQRATMNGFANAAYYFFAMGMALLLIDNIRKHPDQPPED